MLQDAAELADAVQSVAKAAAIIALDLADAGALDPEPLSGP